MLSKPLLKTIGVILVVLLSLYIAFCVWASFVVDSVVDDALNNVPYNHDDVVSEVMYYIINPIQTECEDGYETKTEQSHTFPLVIPFTNTLYYTYNYCVDNTNTNENIYGSANAGVFVKVGIKYFSIYIYDVEMKP